MQIPEMQPIICIRYLVTSDAVVAVDDALDKNDDLFPNCVEDINCN